MENKLKFEEVLVQSDNEFFRLGDIVELKTKYGYWQGRLARLNKDDYCNPKIVLDLSKKFKSNAESFKLEDILSIKIFKEDL